MAPRTIYAAPSDKGCGPKKAIAEVLGKEPLTAKGSDFSANIILRAGNHDLALRERI